MKILAFGDIYGRIGRQAFLKEFPRLRSEFEADISIVNVDNISSGRGAVLEHVRQLEQAGVDIMTGGDHIIDNLPDVADYMNHPESRLIRPANFFDLPDTDFPGMGYKIIEKSGQKVAVIHLLGNVFMDMLRSKNAFLQADIIVEQLTSQGVKHIIVDFHKEATAEIQGLAHYLDGKISAIFGTHTHVQTNDDTILPGGTGLLTDAGMSGPRYSVIGADFASVKSRFLTGISRGKIQQCLDREYVVSAVLFDLDDTGKCQDIQIIRRIGTLV